MYSIAETKYLSELLNYEKSALSVLKMHEQSVVKELTLPIFGSWQQNDSILISAQTGSGKNTFILNSLLRCAVENKRGVLYISNRIAVSTQQQKLICNTLGIPYTYDKRLTWQIPNSNSYVSVSSYQSIFTFIKENREFSQIPYYVIFNEAHYFLEDALFNSLTFSALKKIIWSFPYAVHIFMTATPEDILDTLVYSEMTRFHIPKNDIVRGLNGHLCLRTCVTAYDFPRDYSDYTIIFFQDEEKLIQKIIDSPTKEKWLYFVGKKINGEIIAEKLGIDKADYIDADSKNSENSNSSDDNDDDDEGKLTSSWDSIINKSKFKKKVLVSTKVIDNGVDLDDQDLKNIVITPCEKTELFQMLGRKRKQAGEKVTVYIQVPEKRTLSGYIKKISDAYSFIDDYIVNKEMELITVDGSQICQIPVNFPKPAFLSSKSDNLTNEVEYKYYLSLEHKKYLQNKWDYFIDDYRKLFYISNEGELEINPLAKAK